MNFLGVFGHTVLDHIIQVSKLPDPNTSIEILSHELHFGGTGANIARISAKLGVKVALASFVGDGFPEEYRKTLEGEGIDITDLRAVEGYPTPVAWIFSDPHGDQFAVIEQGPMKVAEKFELLNHTIESSDLIHIGTGRPEYYMRVVSRAKELGKRISFDPSQEIHYVYDPESFERILTDSNYFFANESELSRAMEYLGIQEVEGLLDYTEVVIATKGRNGSEIWSSEGVIHIPATKPAKIGDVTGAGDAYRAGFYAGLSRGFPLKSCGLLASSVASYVIEGKGPQERMPTWEQAVDRAGLKVRP